MAAIADGWFMPWAQKLERAHHLYCELFFGMLRLIHGQLAALAPGRQVFKPPLCRFRP